MGTNNSLQHISNTQSLDFDILNIPTPDMNPEQKLRATKTIPQ